MTVSDGLMATLLQHSTVRVLASSAAIVILQSISDLQRVAKFALGDRRLWLPSTSYTWRGLPSC